MHVQKHIKLILVVQVATNLEKGENMGFLLTHWHCILPVGIILIVYMIMNKNKKENEETTDPSVAKSASLLDQKLASGEITEDEYNRKIMLLR